MSNKEIYLVDCPRDAIQGLSPVIPTAKKVAYINQLIRSELFDCIDFGSFVSPKAVPQMADTAEVIEGIEKTSKTQLLAIIANERGAEIGSQFPKIDFLGYPFSISETFQQRNTKAGIAESFERVKRIQDILSKTDQKLVVYISMAFGNPYGDPWHKELITDWIDRLHGLGISHFSIADTTAEATPELIKEVLLHTKVQFPSLAMRVHLHSRKQHALAKIEVAYTSGCRQFEGAILGYGGCPFAQDSLVGNIPSELLLSRFGRGSVETIQPLLAGFRELVG